MSTMSTRSTQVVARRDGVILRVETIQFSPTPQLKDYMISALTHIDLAS